MKPFCFNKAYVVRAVQKVYVCLLFLIVLTLPAVIHSAQLSPARSIPSHWFDNYPRSLNLNSNPIIERQDQEFAATGHKHGRVQIKVFRGPTQGGGHHHEPFAPHGYWVKQPADDDSHH